MKALMYQYMVGSAPPYMPGLGVQSGLQSAGFREEPKAGSGASVASAANGSTLDAAGARKLLVSAFQEYIQARNTYIAQQVLDAYYAWKSNVAAQRALRAQTEVETLTYYGTVPIDFQNIVGQAMVTSLTGAHVLQAMAVAQNLSRATANLDVYQPFKQALQAHSELLDDVFAGSRQAPGLPNSLQFSDEYNALRQAIQNCTRHCGGDQAIGDALKAFQSKVGPNQFQNLSSQVDAYEEELYDSRAALMDAADEISNEILISSDSVAEATAGVEAAEAAVDVAAQINMAMGPIGIALAGAEMAAMAIHRLRLAAGDAGVGGDHCTARSATDHPLR